MPRVLTLVSGLQTVQILCRCVPWSARPWVYIEADQRLCILFLHHNRRFRFSRIGIADEEVTLQLGALQDLQVHHLTTLLQDACDV